MYNEYRASRRMGAGSVKPSDPEIIETATKINLLTAVLLSHKSI